MTTSSNANGRQMAFLVGIGLLFSIHPAFCEAEEGVWPTFKKDVSAIVTCDSQTCELALKEKNELLSTIRLGLNVLPNLVIARETSQGDQFLAVGRLRRNSKHFLSQDSDQPIEIYINGQLTYSSEKVFQFEVSKQGQAYFTIEARGEQALAQSHTLRVFNLEKGREVSYELEGTEFGEYENSHFFQFTKDGSEVSVSKADDTQNGEWRFYSVDLPKISRQLVPEAAQIEDLIFLSSTEFLALLVQNSSSVFLERVRGLFGQSPAIWRTEVADSKPQSMVVDEKLRWVAVKSWSVQVYDFATGELLINIPVVENPKQQLQLIRSAFDEETYRRLVAMDEAELPAKLGSVTSIGFTGSRLWLFRTIGLELYKVCDEKTGQEQADCMNDTESRLTRVIDYIEIPSIPIGDTETLTVQRNLIKDLETFQPY